ncbi:branched-chain amino acid ABC transporter permease [Microbacterium luteolum]|uniref:Branched-chain amino acid ABC transporter permease n=1 Tax=Microbacterium luteolum TaxID=69367 RepID=A0ABY7XQH7_MICLT|nr:branched-chain amino acid ABC transporter permease [Microbacterium luteolum]WDM44349.1 branched-chain amino acid ABC transporter permease [Microbacterium luteolum]
MIRRVRPSTTKAGSGRIILWGAAITVIALGATFLLDPYRNFQLATIAATFCAVAGLTVLVGSSGQLSLGQAAMMAVGGYGYALTANALTGVGVDGVARFVLAMIGGIAASGLLGLLLGLAAARLRGPYLAGLTLAITIAIAPVTTFFSGVFNGDAGLQIANDSVPPILATLIAMEQWQAWIAILVAGVVVTALASLSHSGIGLHMRATRDDETAARLSGIRTGRIKVIAFLASSVTAGAGGAVACFITQAVSPGAYTLAFSLMLVVAAVIGGLGSISGAALGSALIVLLPWTVTLMTEALPAELAQRLSGNLPVLLFGLLLILVMATARRGLAGIRFRPRPRRDRRASSPRRPQPDSAAADAPPAASEPVLELAVQSVPSAPHERRK